MTPIVPTVHINGTSKTQLVADLEAAHKALKAARAALGNAMPLACDYWPQGKDAHGAAVAQMGARIERLLAIEREIATILRAVCEQRGGRHVA